MYDAFSSDYDRFVNWSARLVAELPFLERQISLISQQSSHPPTILDAACGTGMHAIALAQRGYPVAGADLSTGMIARAQENSVQAGVAVRFEAAGFGGLRQKFHDGPPPTLPFDLLLCLGNSLPHILSDTELASALQDFSACLRSGGIVIIQNRNFDSVLAKGERWMEPQSYQEGDADWLFLRFYDYQTDGLLTFNVVTLQRAGKDGWTQRISSTPLRPWRYAQLLAATITNGFGDVALYGDMTGAPYDPGSSGNLVLVATK